LAIVSGIAVTAAGFALPQAVAAHGFAPAPESLLTVLLAWQLEAHVILPLLAAALVYRWAADKVNAAHPNNPVPRFRYWCWQAGILTLFIALASPIATYDTTLFSVHMVQHLLLTMVAAPLLALGAPITLLLRVSSPETRRRRILPVLHSRLLRAISFPVVTWIVFAAVMWGSHFSPLFDASLDNEAIHLVEHALYLGAALLFWWPVVGADPSPWRLPHPARIAYLFLGMPQSSFLGLAIFSAPAVLYRHYETLVRTWGPTPLADQQLAGGIMWVFGDGLFLIGLVLAVAVWLKAEEAEGKRLDDQLDREAVRKAQRQTAPDTAPQAAISAQPATQPARSDTAREVL
jgi:putative copper resistance protein D